MKSKKITIFLCLLMVVTVFAAVPINVSAEPTYVWVDDDFDSSTPGWEYDHFDKIQDGVDAVVVDGTVHVNAGTYYESVAITKSLILEGEEGDATIIQNPGNGYPSGIVSYWKFEEGSGGITGDSVGDNDGTLVNGPIWTTGQVDSALSFDGVNDYVDCGNNPSLTFGLGVSFTYEAWIYAKSTTGKWRGIIYHDVFGASQGHLGISSGGYLGGGSGDGSTWRTHVTSYNVPSNVWVHVVMSLDRNTDTLTFYANGAEVGSYSHPYIPRAPTRSLVIGLGSQTYGSEYFNGFIDEVAIWNRALSSTEIQQHYNDGLLGQPHHGFEIGIYTCSRSDVTIKNLNVQEFYRGIYLTNSNNNIITGNTVANNKEGITLYNSDNNIITDNSILNNQQGLSLDHSNDNTLHHNNIIGNSNQLSLISSSNTWDDGMGEGNHWSDYAGEDNDGDGVGDTELPHPGIGVDPISYWKLDDGSGTTAIDSADENDGTLIPSGPIWTNGQIGGALSFDGVDEYMDCGNNPSLTFGLGVSFTYEAWIYAKSTTGKWRGIIYHDDRGASQGHLGISPEGYLEGGSGDGSSVQTHVTSYNVPSNVWVHVGMSLDRNTDTLTFYANGAEVGSYSHPYIPSTPTLPLVIGLGAQTYGSEYFHGLIDEAAVYDRTLTAKEIQQHYNDGLAGIEITPDANTIGLWHLDEGSGNTATDSSNNNNHGTLMPMVLGPIWTTGQIGGALDFDGVDDYVDCGNNPSLTFGLGVSFTYEAWIYAKSTTGKWRGIIYHDDRGASQGHLGISPEGYLGGGSGDGSSVQTHVTSYNVPSNVWVHVVMSLDRNTDTLTFYANGAEVGSYSHPYIPSAPTLLLVIGLGAQTYGSEYFHGLIDEAAVYDRTLTAEEIQQHYNDGLAGTPISVILGVDWYPLVDPNPNTPTGTDVGVLAGDGVEMQFSNVITPGFSYAEQVPGSPPANFKLVPVKTFYDISSTATFDGIITISIPYDPTGIKPQKQDNLKLKRWNEVTNQWDDCTLWVDTYNHIIYGETLSLSIFAIMYENKPPVVMITGPPTGSLYVVGSSIEFTGSFTDEDTEDTHTAEWTFTSQGVPITIDGTVSENGGSGTVTDSYTFTETGVYMVKLTVWDNDDGEGSSELVGELAAMVVIYDPEGGFVTGGGWINSPEGAYVPDSSLTGKASFGFVAKYKKGASEPIGNTEFKFEVADFDFHSTHYEWLVIGGSKAQFKGTGTINDEGEYKFMLWATDGGLQQGGGPDMFRIKIWEEDELFEGETVIYDNKEETELGGGQIMIHNGK